MFILKKMILILSSKKNWLITLDYLPSYIFLKLIRMIPDHFPDDLKSLQHSEIRLVLYLWENCKEKCILAG